MKYNKLYLKITTLPNQLEVVDFESDEIQIFREKYEAHKGFLGDSEVELAYLNESSVNGSFARVYSITLGFVHEGIPVVKTMFGEEKDLLDKLLSVLRQDEFSASTLVMYNRAFILTFLSKRLRKHKYSINTLPVSLQVFDKKPWTIKGSKCIQDYVKGIGYQTENFAETCFIHDIQPDFMSGSDVARSVKKDETEKIHQSDVRYVHSLILIDREISSESELGKMTAVIEEIGQVVQEPVNALDHIVASGNLSAPVIKAIVEFTEKEGLNKSDVLTLVQAALSKTKEYQNVTEEDYIQLKEALGLVVDYSRIQCVADKGNLGKKEADALIKLYGNEGGEVKQEIVDLTEEFLTEKNKIGQKRAKEALEYLKEKLQ